LSSSSRCSLSSTIPILTPFELFTHRLQKIITNGRADAMKRSCSDTLMHFHNKNRPFSESRYRLDLHLCDLEYNPLSHYKTFYRISPAVYVSLVLLSYQFPHSLLKYECPQILHLPPFSLSGLTDPCRFQS